MEKTTAIQAQLLPFKDALYWPSMKVLAMTQPNAAVLSKATFPRGMVVSMARRCCHQNATQGNAVLGLDRRDGRSFEARPQAPTQKDLRRSATLIV